ncbi:MAG: TetR family transcriptional regulator [Phycisphaeraceae bacterium]|nr:TetR family transcriptional regulator [Phycisphaeraceae bacterium]
MAAGRPKAFDPDKALDCALKVFWQKGYEGASLPDLTEAMGINRPSLYAQFGNKKQLFLKAIDRYIQGPASPSAQAIAQPTARKVVEALLFNGIKTVSNPRTPHGCLLVQGALVCGDDAQDVCKELAKRRKAAITSLAERFEAAKVQGDLPAESDARTLASYVMAVVFGMAVQATHGVSRQDMTAVADWVLASWPSK